MGQRGSYADKQASDTKRLARSRILSASGGGDRARLSVVQHDRRRHPATGYSEAVSFRRGNSLLTVFGGAGQYANQGRTYKLEIISRLD